MTHIINLSAPIESVEFKVVKDQPAVSGKVILGATISAYQNNGEDDTDELVQTQKFQVTMCSFGAKSGINENKTQAGITFTDGTLNTAQEGLEFFERLHKATQVGLAKPHIVSQIYSDEHEEALQGLSSPNPGAWTDADKKKYESVMLPKIKERLLFSKDGLPNKGKGRMTTLAASARPTKNTNGNVRYPILNVEIKETENFKIEWSIMDDDNWQTRKLLTSEEATDHFYPKCTGIGTDGQKTYEKFFRKVHMVLQLDKVWVNNRGEMKATYTPVSITIVRQVSKTVSVSCNDPTKFKRKTEEQKTTAAKVKAEIEEALKNHRLETTVSVASELPENDDDQSDMEEEQEEQEAAVDEIEEDEDEDEEEEEKPKLGKRHATNSRKTSKGGQTEKKGKR